MDKDSYILYRNTAQQARDMIEFLKTKTAASLTERDKKQFTKNMTALFSRDPKTGKRRYNSQYEFARIMTQDLEDHSSSYFSYLAEALAHALSETMTYRRDRKSTVGYNPLGDSLNRIKSAAKSACSSVTNVKVDFVVSSDPKHPAPHKVSPLWEKQTELAGGTSIGNRFISRADLVDQIGEFDLFQIEYYMGSDATVKFGFLARYRDSSIRGFGTRADTAMQWARRQVVLYGTRKLSK